MLHLTFENDVMDASTLGNNGTVGNPANVTYVAGKVGQAIQFKGVDGASQITVANSDSLQFNQEMTVSYWLRMDDHRGQEGNFQSTILKGIHAIFGKQNDHSGDLFSYLTTNNGIVNLGVGGQGDSVNGVFAVGEWVHVTQVISSNSIKMYINGSKLVDTTVAQPFDFSVANTKNLTIGRLGNGWYPLYGTLDDFRMYNYALTDSEILDLVN